MPPDVREYWTSQMDAAHGFMRDLLAYPLAECGEKLSCLRLGAAEADVEIVCAPDKKLGLYERLFHVRCSLVDKILSAAEALARRGYVLRVEDGYRSPDRQATGARSDYAFSQAVKMARWELDGAEPTAELVLKRLSVWTATTPKFANHTSGSALDVSLLNRRDGSMVDLGAPYPELSHLTPMDSPFIGRQARANRRMLCELFAEQDFLPYPYEFWHFSHGDADYEMIAQAGRRARYGPVHWSDAEQSLRPVDDMLEVFVTVEDIDRRLSAC